MTWLNQKRLHDYPRLIGFSMWVVLILNFMMHKGWFGGFGGIIGFDFLTLYSAGLIYWQDVSDLYNWEVQAQVEQIVFSPTPMSGGINVFSSPPYVALVYSLFNLFPYARAFWLCTVINIAAFVIASIGIYRWLIPEYLKLIGFTKAQFLIILFSFLPVIFGLFLGQNNAITLLFVSGVVIFILRDRQILAGVLTGLLIYKPHFALGFIILFLGWAKWRSILSAAAVAVLWAGSVVMQYGLEPYTNYLQAVPNLVHLPYGIGRYLETTLFALFATSLPESALPVLLKVQQGILIAVSLGLGLLAFTLRKKGWLEKSVVIILAILYPFLAAPHTLHYDLVLLIPVLVLWSRISPSPFVLYTAITVYLGSFFLLLLSRPTGLALLALLPIGMLGLILFDKNYPNRLHESGANL